MCVVPTSSLEVLRYLGNKLIGEKRATHGQRTTDLAGWQLQPVTLWCCVRVSHGLLRCRQG